jgi:outer membrane lipoprotein-sorting protein
MRTRPVAALLVALVVPLLAGCPKPAVRPYPPPSGEELLTVLKARAEHLKTLRMTAKVDYMENGGQRAKVKANILVARGGKLRIEADSPLGGALATLTSDGVKFAMLDLRANRFLAGPAKACNVARLIRIAIPPDDIVAILMGGAPLSGTIKGVSWDPNNGGREVLTLAQPDGGDLVLKLDARDKRWDVMRAERHDPAGKLLWRVTNEDFKDHGDVRLPDTEDVQEPPHGADAEIKLRGVEPNIEIKDELFRLPPPENVQPEPADC